MTVWRDIDRQRQRPAPADPLIGRYSPTALAERDTLLPQVATGFWRLMIRRVVELGPGPMTAAEIAAEVERLCPGRWKSKSIERSVGKLAKRGELLEVQGVDCTRYVLAEAAS